MKKLFLILLFSIQLTLTAQQTYIPDDNFEQALINLGYDIPPINDSVPTANIQLLNVLDVKSNNISDLTGIEDFTTLKELYCQSNLLISLNVSNNSKLNTLYCYENQLDVLDVSNLTSLQYLLCGNNKLTQIKIGDNHPDFISLNCAGNKLTSLDVSKHTELLWLICSRNELTTLDISQNTLLRTLLCNDNKLVKLNVQNGNNGKMRKLGSMMGMDARNNANLTCIQVDNQTASENNSDWAKDIEAVYSEDCGSTGAMENIKETNINIHPNPALEYIEINCERWTPSEADEIKIYNSIGECVITESIHPMTSCHRMNIEGFPIGLYFIQFGNYIEKFVVVR